MDIKQQLFLQTGGSDFSALEDTHNVKFKSFPNILMETYIMPH